MYIVVATEHIKEKEREWKMKKRKETLRNLFGLV